MAFIGVFLSPDGRESRAAIATRALLFAKHGQIFTGL